MKRFFDKYKSYLPYAILLILVVLILAPSREFVLPYASSDSAPDNVGLLLNEDSTTLNSTLTVSVALNTHSTAINAVGIIIDFDPSMLQVASVDTSSSFCTLYTDRTYSQPKGYINLFCGKQTPGFTGENILETITFKTISYGTAAISVDPKSMVLKNDGKGTNILNNFEKKSISVILSQ